MRHQEDEREENLHETGAISFISSLMEEWFDRYDEIRPLSDLDLILIDRKQSGDYK